MLQDIDSIFDIPYTLPVLTHSVAVATRTPTSGFTQASKYMPDYGGVLESPGIGLKNNSLNSGLLFHSRPSATHALSKIQGSISNECVVAAKYPIDSLPSYNKTFSVVRSIGKKLYLDRLQFDCRELIHVERYAEELFAENISRIKYSENLPNFLLVCFDHGVKTVRLNQSLGFNDGLESHTALEVAASLSDRQGIQVKDTCLNHFNLSIQAVASDSAEAGYVKLYDLSSSRQPFQTITWDAHNPEQSLITNSLILDASQRATGRKFIQTGSIRQGVQQLDNVPTHLVNMVITSPHKVVLLDPRIERLGSVYVDRACLPSFYPNELIKRTEFSQKNDHQFYTLSNIHLRVFDTRYPHKPVNQVNHMLDSNTYDVMNLKLIKYANNELETLCSCSSSQLCFSTFDQTQQTNLINPKSIHLPYHIEPETHDDTKVSGLSILPNLDKENSEDRLFSVFQLNSRGQIYVRSFSTPTDDNDGDDMERTAIIEPLKKLISDNPSSRLHWMDNNMRNSTQSSNDMGDLNFINILDNDNDADLENRCLSRRALERFEKMKDKLGRL